MGTPRLIRFYGADSWRCSRSPPARRRTRPDRSTSCSPAGSSKTAARHGGIYDSHKRSESSHGSGLLAAVDEVLEIGEKANIPVHIAHLKALGSDVWGTSGDVIARIDAARARGLSVTADQYPYRASGTRFSSALVPQWARADSREAMFRRFENADIAPRLRTEMAENLAMRGGPAAVRPPPIATEPGYSYSASAVSVGPVCAMMYWRPSCS